MSFFFKPAYMALSSIIDVSVDNVISRFALMLLSSMIMLV